jgi:hypothetical protein
VDGKILINVKYSNPRLAARATIEATAEVMILPIVDRWMNKKHRKATGLREAVVAALELESAANTGVVAQTGDNYRAEGHQLALDTWVAGVAKKKRDSSLIRPQSIVCPQEGLEGRRHVYKWAGRVDRCHEGAP